MSKNKFASKEAFLLDALDYYTVDPFNRRCIDDFGHCVYSSITINKPTSEGCLIGRNLNEQDAIELDNINKKDGINIGQILVDDDLKTYIPEEMIVLGMGFLWSCQNSHDNSNNWDAEGLSDEGVDNVTDIINKFGLDKTLFTKYLTNGTEENEIEIGA